MADTTSLAAERVNNDIHTVSMIRAVPDIVAFTALVDHVDPISRLSMHTFLSQYIEDHPERVQW